MPEKTTAYHCFHLLLNNAPTAVRTHTDLKQLGRKRKICLNWRTFFFFKPVPLWCWCLARLLGFNFLCCGRTLNKGMYCSPLVEFLWGAAVVGVHGMVAQCLSRTVVTFKGSQAPSCCSLACCDWLMLTGNEYCPYQLLMCCYQSMDFYSMMGIFLDRMRLFRGLQTFCLHGPHRIVFPKGKR